MGVADIQSANEDLRKQLDDKQHLIKELTQQIVVSSSLSDTAAVQKKKMRRETWCGPKVRQQSLCKCAVGVFVCFLWGWVSHLMASWSECCPCLPLCACVC